MTRILIGIDDTDNKDSRGTGFRSRQLGKLIEKNNLGIVDGITRHQLFFDTRIPYTSQNSSACLDVFSEDLKNLTELAQNFLLRESADGSDAGLAISLFDKIDNEIINWGIRAKKEVLTQDEAIDIAKRKKIFLEGLTGNRDGIIGSLAAIGLRKSGNDGRFVWLRGKEIRELKGIYKVEHLFNKIKVDSITDKSGNNISKDAKINVGEWVRPVLKNNKIIIIADKSLNNKSYEWKVATKDYIKSISD
ncbi:MAG: hypothetical protein K8R58_04860 [Bacteroidales bacterium]|nr:hypothetical protein [Bacteroidales bacterium]